MGNKPVQMDIDKGLITIKDEKGDYLFALKGKVRVETKLRDCEKCSSEGRKKELEALEQDRKTLDKLQKDLEKQNEEQNAK